VVAPGCSFKLEVHSEIGEGTTVTMRIPLRKQFRVGRESPRVIVSDFRKLEHDATTLPSFHYLTKICSRVDPDCWTLILLCVIHVTDILKLVVGNAFMKGQFLRYVKTFLADKHFRRLTQM